MTTNISTGDNRGVIAGRDIRDANLVNTGDVLGSYNAIGVGARVVIQQIQEARSAVDELAAELRLAETRLADAVARKLQQLTAAVEKTARLGRPNPYRSLLDYRLEDAPFFYGRDAAIGDLLGKIHAHRLTVLHAASGAGKSSLLQAGLMARLLAAGHLPLRVRPYRDEPGRHITEAFLPDLHAAPELERFRTMPLPAFLQSVTGYLGDSTLYLFLDQFEEFFTELPRDAQERFATELADCLDDGGLDVRWVLSLRKEYFSNLALFQPRVAPFENEYFLAAFRPNEARAVIVEPAAKHGVTYESEALVDAILDDLREEDGSLQPPQVQLVCYELFEEAQVSPTPQTITAALYNQPRGSGQSGARGILGNHLNRVLERMPAADRELAHIILEGMVSSQGRRMLATQKELTAYAQQRDSSFDDAQIAGALRRLVDSRLLRSDEDENDVPVYELAHDYLLGEIQLDPRVLAQKAAQELLRQETAAYRQFGTLLSEDKYEIIHSQRASLLLDEQSEALLLKSEAALQQQEQARERSRRRVLNRTRWALAGALLALLFATIAAVPTVRDQLRRNDARRQGRLITIPSSTALLGDAELSKADLALPEMQYDVPGFQIEEAEVSIRRYLLCVESKACSPSNADPIEYEPPARWDYPVTYVTFYQADDFCRWIGRRLPSAEEWERSARGVDGDLWPGGMPEPTDLSQAVFTYAGTQPAEIQPTHFANQGGDRQEIYDLAGNVWEWTATNIGDEYESWMIIKGGSAIDWAADLKTMARHESESKNYHARTVGFRCAIGE